MLEPGFEIHITGEETIVVCGTAVGGTDEHRVLSKNGIKCRFKVHKISAAITAKTAAVETACQKDG